MAVGRMRKLKRSRILHNPNRSSGPHRNQPARAKPLVAPAFLNRPLRQQLKRSYASGDKPTRRGLYPSSASPSRPAAKSNSASAGTIIAAVVKP